jgi:hypothetical protein
MTSTAAGGGRRGRTNENQADKGNVRKGRQNMYSTPPSVLITSTIQATGSSAPQHKNFRFISSAPTLGRKRVASPKYLDFDCRRSAAGET